MKPFHVSIALLLAGALFLFGCPSHGMEPPLVCKNICPLGQTQASYPDCACSGSEYSPGTGGATGYCTNMCPPGYSHYGYPDCTCYGTGIGGMSGVDVGGMNGSGNIGWVGGSGSIGVPNIPSIPVSASTGQGGYWWGTSNIGAQEDILLTGGPAGPITTRGMFLILLTTTNSDDMPYEDAELSIGAISVYRSGVGGGWELLQGGVKNYSLRQLDGRMVLLGRGRLGIGAHTRLLIELRNVTVFYDGDAYPIRAPKSMYAFANLVPVKASGTSAVTLTLDLRRTFSVSEDGFTYFTPTGEMASIMEVGYLVRDDGTAELSGGLSMLREDFAVNATGDSVYVIVDGITATCMEDCTIKCPSPYSAVCHASCAQHCAGAPSEFEVACFDGTKLDSCSAVNKPYYCGPTGHSNADCKKCGCPQGQTCDSDGHCIVAEVKTCSDGTLPNRCSADNKPNYCSGDGKMMPLCTICGCPSGKICTADGTCR